MYPFQWQCFLARAKHGFRNNLGKSLVILSSLTAMTRPGLAADDEIAYLYSFSGRYTIAQLGQNQLLESFRSARLVYIFLKNHRFIYSLGRDNNLYFLSGGEDEYHDTALDSHIDTLSTPAHTGQLDARQAPGNCTMTGEIENSVTIVCKGQEQKSGRPYHFVFVSDDTEASFSPGHEPDDLASNVKHAMFLFDDIYRERGLEQVQLYVNHCYKAAKNTRQLPSVLACGAIDFAGALIEEWASDNSALDQERAAPAARDVTQRLTQNLIEYQKESATRIDGTSVPTLVTLTENFSRVYLKQMILKRATQ